MSQNRFTAAYLSLARLLVRAIVALVGRLEIRGQENVPSAGPFILVANHVSKTDAPLALLAFRHHRLRVFAASKWRGNPLFGPLLSLAGAIWVKRGEVDRKALNAALQALQGGEVLGMAPEGTRSRTGVLQRARQGAAYLASHARAPVLPVGIVNSDLFQGNLLRLRRTVFQINIGEPFELPDVGRRPRMKEMAAYTELIMAHIAHLLPKRYHGYYADSQALAALRAGQSPWPAACEAAGLDLTTPTPADQAA